ncbi:MAG: hybrid sensor histidine kinase/response regulator [Anaerolineales bacterium]|nr:hybrid sensor histidine kinase/response regulator [Anaerolineales bacterium]
MPPLRLPLRFAQRPLRVRLTGFACTPAVNQVVTLMLFRDRTTARTMYGMKETIVVLDEPAPAETPRLDVLPASVLVVDDDPRNIELLTHVLEPQGFGVLAAEDGEDGLALAHTLLPDVILLDVLMPQPDGYEVCRRLKADPVTLYIPIVLITALRGARERARGAEAGADEFISKPFDAVELVTRIKSLVRIKRLYDRLRAANAELERRVAERTVELQRALAELRELDRLKSEFITNVAHELRTPVLHVKGIITLLADGALGELTPEQARGVRIAEEATEQLERVVEDIVDFGNMHDHPLTLTPVPVYDVCQNAVETLMTRAARRGITVRATVPFELPPVLADGAALSRVIRHLLDNAIKFSPLNSEVQLVAERRGDRVRISVSDHGPGIPEDERERIFAVFYQSDGSTTRRAGGMGLGLALVRKLLEAHHTHIELESELGRGSTFSFELLTAS